MTIHAGPTLAQQRVLTRATPEVLSLITQPDHDLAIWQRGSETPGLAWLSALPTHALPSCRLELGPTAVQAALDKICNRNGTPTGSMRERFTRDVAELAGRFAHIAGVNTVSLRLDVVTTDACRRWHRDCVPLRMICTYRGAGTWWMPPQLAALALQQADDDLTCQARQLKVGDVALFKGCGWAGQTHDAGIVHRSPRMDNTGQSRLVLVLDPPPLTRPGQ